MCAASFVDDDFGNVGFILFDPGNRFFEDCSFLKGIYFGPDLLRGCGGAIGLIKIGEAGQFEIRDRLSVVRIFVGERFGARALTPDTADVLLIQLCELVHVRSPRRASSAKNSNSLSPEPRL